MRWVAVPIDFFFNHPGEVVGAFGPKQQFAANPRMPVELTTDIIISAERLSDLLRSPL